MNLRDFFVFSILALAFGITGCNEQSKPGESVSQQPQSIVEGLTIANASVQSVAVVKNDLAVLYANNNKLKFFLNSKKVTLDEGGVYSPHNLWLVSKGQYVYALWWQKFVYGEKDGKQNQIIMGKSLFVRGSNDYGKTFFPKVRVNSAHGVLPDLEVAADEAGNVSVVYSDERVSNFQVYTNSSRNGGKTWLNDDIRLDTVLGQEAKKVASNAGTAHIVYVNDKLIALWQQFDKNNGNPLTRVISRESYDHGATWGPEKVLFQDKGDLASTLDVLVAGDGLYAFWLDRRKKGLVIFSRNNDGQWRASEEIAPGTKDTFAVSWLKGVADDKYLYITFTYEKKPYKDYISFIKFDRKNFKWYPNVHRLDRHPPQLKYVAKSMNSDIAMLPNGAVLTVWEDYDDIVPGIHLDYMNTKDQTWQDDKIRITKPGLLDARTPKIFLGKDKLWVVFYHSEVKETGRPPITEIASLGYKLKGDSDLEITTMERKIPDIKKSKERIREKAEAIWKARLANDRETEWSLHDPVYRTRFRKEKWLNSKSGIKFDSYTVDKINIQGLYAKVEGKVTYKLPEEVMRSKVLDPEDKKQVDPTLPVDSAYAFKFGWFYDDWYFVPEVMFMNHIDD